MHSVGLGFVHSVGRFDSQSLVCIVLAFDFLGFS